MSSSSRRPIRSRLATGSRFWLAANRTRLLGRRSLRRWNSPRDRTVVVHSRKPTNGGTDRWTRDGREWSIREAERVRKRDVGVEGERRGEGGRQIERQRERYPTRFAFPRRGPNSSRRLDQCQDECWINLRRNYLLRRSLSALITSPNDQS